MVLKITRITVWNLDLPLSEPYWLSGGRLKYDRLDSTFVRIETDAGPYGWGEGCPWGHSYLPASGHSLRSALDLLAPVLIDQDPRSIDVINRLMDLTLPGHLYAKSPIDIACWDIVGKVSGLPLWQLFGGSETPQVDINSSIATRSADEMVADIEAARSRGYRTHSAKVGGLDANREIKRMQTICSGLQQDEKITFDINRAWSPGEAVQILNGFGMPVWIEQPCETIAQCAHVAKRVRQPIMLDECLHTFQDHLDAWRLHACEGAKVKPNRLGGLSRARSIRDFGISIGWQMHVEDVGGTALADTTAIHLAKSTPSKNRLASWLAHQHLAVDPVPGQGVRNNNGFVTLSQAPGIGVDPDPDELGRPSAVYESART